jgi:methylated-DNA-[protein]-cysteine S-methyltransferase
MPVSPPDRPSIHHCTHPTPLGTMTVAATARGLVGCWFEDDKHPPSREGWQPLGDGTPATAQRILKKTSQQLDRYFKGTNVDPWHQDIPIDFVHGTPFQRSVWQALLGIARGQSQTYAQIAQQVGRPAAVRAVGSAIGRNPISILVPCHRVLGSNGSLTGYAGGLHRKQALLQHEGLLARA